MCEADIKFVVRQQALCGFVREPDGFHGVVVGMMGGQHMGFIVDIECSPGPIQQKEPV